MISSANWRIEIRKKLEASSSKQEGRVAKNKIVTVLTLIHDDDSNTIVGCKVKRRAYGMVQKINKIRRIVCHFGIGRK